MPITEQHIDLSDPTRSSTRCRTPRSRSCARRIPCTGIPSPTERRFWAVTRYDGHPASSTATSTLLLRARRHLARGPAPGPDQGTQVDDRHGPAASRPAARADQRRFTPRAVGVWSGPGPDRRQDRSSTRHWPVRSDSTSCARSPRRSRCRCSPRSSGAAVRAPRDHRDRRPAAGHPGPGVRVGHDRPAHELLPFSSPAALEMFEFGRRLAAARRKNPGPDIITQLAFEPLTQQEFDTYFVLLATAGNETTRHTITHGLLALLEHPDAARAAALAIRRWADPPPTRCCAGRRPCTTSAGPRPSTPSCAARRSTPATRSRPGSPRGIATRTRSRIRSVRHPPFAQPAHGVRAGRDPPLPRRPPRPDGDPDHVRGAARAGRPRSSSTDRPSGCARTSSTGSNGCRSG